MIIAKLSSMVKMILLSASILLFSVELKAQSTSEQEAVPPNHIVLTIGHSAIPTVLETGEKDGMRFIPTWGLSYEYNISEKFALALKGEIEAANYIISDEEESALEREFPASLSLLGTYKVYNEFGLILGPGIEFEADENLFIIQFGLNYEVELPGNWILIPEFAYELKGGHTGAISIGLGVGVGF